MVAAWLCGIFAVLAVVLFGLAIRNMTKIINIDSFDDAKSRMAGHLVYGLGASICSFGFVVSLIFVIIDYIKH